MYLHKGGLDLNSVEIKLIDVYTTTYFLQAHTMIEEHRLAKEGDGES